MYNNALQRDCSYAAAQRCIQAEWLAEPIDAVEAFTTVACTWLVVPPKHHQQLFNDTFSEIRVNALYPSLPVDDPASAGAPLRRLRRA